MLIGTKPLFPADTVNASALRLNKSEERRAVANPSFMVSEEVGL